MNSTFIIKFENKKIFGFDISPIQYDYFLGKGLDILEAVNPNYDNDSTQRNPCDPNYLRYMLYHQTKVVIDSKDEEGIKQESNYFVAFFCVYMSVLHVMGKKYRQGKWTVKIRDNNDTPEVMIVK